MIGLVILAIILLPLTALAVAAVADSKRTVKVGAMFTGAFLLQVAGMVMGMVVLAAVLKFIMV